MWMQAQTPPMFLYRFCFYKNLWKWESVNMIMKVLAEEISNPGTGRLPILATTMQWVGSYYVFRCRLFSCSISCSILLILESKWVLSIAIYWWIESFKHSHHCERLTDFALTPSSQIWYSKYGICRACRLRCLCWTLASRFRCGLGMPVPATCIRCWFANLNFNG